MKSIAARILAVVAVLSLIANVLLYLRYSTGRPLATVGGDVITKKQYQDQLEHQIGQSVLSKMVFQQLVTQAAAKAGVTPSAKDVDDRIAAIARRAPQLLAPYQSDPNKLAEFKQDLSTNIALENLRIKDVKLTPAEVAAYYAKHQTEFALPQQVKTTTVVTPNSMNAATATDLLRQHTPTDVIARQSGMHVIGVNGYSPNLEGLPPALKKQISDYVQKAKTGDVRTFHVDAPGGGVFLTFQVANSSSASVPPLTQVQGQAERAARLERAPSESEELARLYQAAKPTFSADKYAAYFETIQKYPLGKEGSKKTANMPEK